MNRRRFCANFGDELDLVGEAALRPSVGVIAGESRAFSPPEAKEAAALTAESVDLDFPPEILTLKLLHLGGRDLSAPEDLSLNTER